MARILIFGASITFGAWDREGGWVQRLRKFLDEKTLTDPNFYCLAYNLGVSGDTTEDLLERFEFEARQRMKEEEETIIIISTGINDSQFIHSQNDLRISPEKFKENIQELINIAKKFTSKIIFVGFTPVDESKVDPIPWKPDSSYKNEYVQQSDNTVKSACKENKIYFIEIFDEWMKSDYKSLLEDGIHPNSEGHKKIFEKVKDFLIQNRII